MTAGVPGTGISGLYYVLLVCWMPVREIRLVVLGRSSFARWRFIAGQLAIVLAIVAALYGEGLAIKCVAMVLSSPAATPGVASHEELTESAPVIAALAPTLFVLTPWLMLGGVILTIQIMCRLVPTIGTPRPRGAAAEAMPGSD